MDIAGKNVLGVLYDFSWIICKDNFCLCALLSYQLTVVIYIVYACKWMLIFSKKLPVTLQIQNIAVRIDSSLIYLIQRHQGVSYLIAWITEHQNNLLCASGNSL